MYIYIFFRFKKDTLYINTYLYIYIYLSYVYIYICEHVLYMYTIFCLHLYVCMFTPFYAPEILDGLSGGLNPRGGAQVRDEKSFATRGGRNQFGMKIMRAASSLPAIHC